MKLRKIFKAEQIAWSCGACATLLLACGSDAEESPLPGGAAGSSDLSGPCENGARRCVGASFEECETGTWSVVEVCETEGLCTDTFDLCSVAPDACPDGCLAPACEVGQTDCAGNLVVECNEKRSGFETVENCGAPCGGNHCSAGSCQPDVCAEPGLFFQNTGDAMDRAATCSDDCSTVTPVE